MKQNMLFFQSLEVFMGRSANFNSPTVKGLLVWFILNAKVIFVEIL